MTCPLTLTNDKHRTGRAIVRCQNCESWGLLPPSGNVSDLKLPCPRQVRGPGTHLHLILGSLGVVPTSGCQCAERMNQMDAWGPELCRQNRDTILGWLRESYDEAGVLDKLRAGANAVAQGLPKSIEGILDLAIERSETQWTEALARA